MRTYSIRISDKDAERVRQAVSENGFSMNALGKIILYRTLSVGLSDLKQRTGRASRTKSEMLHFKLEREALAKFKALCSEAGFSQSEVFRHYLLNNIELFSKPKKFKHRIKHDLTDFYQTPMPVAKALIEQLPRLGVETDADILEPCCGEGAITDVLCDYGYTNIRSFDLNFGDHRQDFLKFDGSADVIITNPPFSQAGAFLDKAIEVAPTVMMLLPLDFLTSKERYGSVWNNTTFKCAECIVFSRRPLMTTEKQTVVHKAGAVSFAWFVFRRTSDDIHMVVSHHDLKIG